MNFENHITLEEFFKTVFERYDNAASSFVTIGGPYERLKRNRQGSISDEIEELVAEFLYVNSGAENNESLYVVVDLSLSIKVEGKRTKTVYPDIVFFRKDDNGINHILYMADVKTDPGWFRNGLKELASKHQGHISLMHESTELSHTDRMISEEGKQISIKEEFVIEKDCPYDFIVISSANGSKSFNRSEDELNKDEQSRIRAFILSRGVHPNMEGITLDRCNPDEEMKNKLIERVRSCISSLF